MNETADKTSPLNISEETAEKARAAIQEAFGTLTEHVQRIANDFTDFDKRREEMQRRMASGARRSTRRIV